jgi:hypothetical protein
MRCGAADALEAYSEYEDVQYMERLELMSK